MVRSRHRRVPGDGVNDLEACRKALAAFAKESGALPIVEALADIWVEESQRKVPVDTGQLKARINVTSIREMGNRAEATLQADTPYAGFVEYGTRYQRPQPYFRPGRDKAAGEVDRFGVSMSSAMARALKSGGSWNPRSL